MKRAAVEAKYDRVAAGKRLKARRTELKMSRAEVAKMISKAETYYSDIERGTCGMSVETLIDLSECLKLSTDYILNGNVGKKKETETPEVLAMNMMMKKCRTEERTKILNMVKVFLDN